MIVWLNGAFGAGKTTVAEVLSGLAPGVRLFDPEYVGFRLRRFVPVPTAISRTYRCGASWWSPSWPGWSGTTPQSGWCR